ncbi:hypothetical protein KFK09_020559 [Dendrobium nobile]|uniref:Uncharacterized protein n=1 Tax=Dendrobium nobile TaxID=94219 RepID=A0A8T3ALA4_DENNO|nr:hypothetical protein KFK09_020559 [Dendrobium nobile]
MPPKEKNQKAEFLLQLVRVPSFPSNGLYRQFLGEFSPGNHREQQERANKKYNFAV